MRKGLLLLFLAAGVVPGVPFALVVSAQTIPSKETFLNEVYRDVVDTTTAKYYIRREAFPCGFIKYSYDDWVKYRLKEEVPITIMDELAQKCYHDQRPGTWLQDSLVDALHVTRAYADSTVRPPAGPSPDKLTRKQRKAIRKESEKQYEASPERWMKYRFSKPEFTDDGRYAVIEVIFDCGPLCGSKYTLLFRRTGPESWKMIGKVMDWIS